MCRRVVRALGLFAALIIACSAGISAHAQDIDPKALEQSRKILELTNTRAMGEQMLTLLLPQIVNLVVKANPSKGDEVRALMEQYFEPSLREALPELFDECATVYARHFTADELTELAAFYGTPLGQKLISAQSALMVDLNQVGQKWGITAAQRALKKLAPVFKERGLQVPI
jgi:uncharacterized protein